MRDDVTEPLNIGSAHLVTINELVSIVEEIAGLKLRRRYNLDAPRASGVGTATTPSFSNDLAGNRRSAWSRGSRRRTHGCTRRWPDAHTATVRWCPLRRAHEGPRAERPRRRDRSVMSTKSVTPGSFTDAQLRLTDYLAQVRAEDSAPSKRGGFRSRLPESFRLSARIILTDAIAFCSEGKRGAWRKVCPFTCT